MAKSYESAGVSLEAGYEGVRRIKKHVAATNRPGSMGNIGSFGGIHWVVESGAFVSDVRSTIFNERFVKFVV